MKQLLTIAFFGALLMSSCSSGTDGDAGQNDSTATQLDTLTEVTGAVTEADTAVVDTTKADAAE